MYLLSLSKTSSEWLVLKLTYGSLCMFLSMGGTEYHLKEFFPCHIKTPWDTGVKIKQPFVIVFFGWLVGVLFRSLASLFSSFITPRR